ncbi:MAG: WYL domain-containing protein [Ignavibacteria bacterium]|nr:WYL domain-containing protein [Ignavibacteria bacterium]
MSEYFVKFALKSPMPVNKNALTRYLTLDKCFRNTGRMYFIEDLVDACNQALKELDPKCKGVQKRQVQYDIDYMRSSEGFGAPITAYYFDKRKYYRYEDPKFTIHQKLLPHNIIELSKEVVCFLTQFEGLAPLKELYEKLPELEKFYDIKEKESFVEFDFNFDYEGLNNFTEIFSAIMHNKVLEIKYHSFVKNENYSYIFHPHYLKEYNHRWYVIGYNETENKFNWVLGLERILSVKELVNKDYVPPKESIKDYFYDIIGITKEENKKPQKITLMVHPSFEKYITTRPFHPSQKNKKINEEGWREIELNLIINEELINNLMPYIHYIKIESPEELKEKVKERLETGIKNLQ